MIVVLQIKYKGLQWVLDTVAKKIERLVGKLDRVLGQKASKIVHRHSLANNMLCASVVAASDFMLSSVNYNPNELKDPPGKLFFFQLLELNLNTTFEKYSSTTTVITLQYKKEQFEDFLGCRLWHRKPTLVDYPENPTYMVLYLLKRLVLSNLDPSTEYFCKVTIFSITGEAALEDISNNHRKLIVHCVNTAFVPPIAPCKPDGDLEIPSLIPKKHLTQKDYDYRVDVIRSLNN
ncbi:hypothetical protein NE237_020282 [Protea cynaroides]|uniref:VIN3-like fibronectin type-III domain-containing protein n=1 Tax=Protea cynaroides TaxID=273540 RepID=A0A9Q0HA86_9MAGN|nr:hypothetical protein NE237_020282 [Protea cynaroides]